MYVKQEIFVFLDLLLCVGMHVYTLRSHLKLMTFLLFRYLHNKIYIYPTTQYYYVACTSPE